LGKIIKAIDFKIVLLFLFGFLFAVVEYQTDKLVNQMVEIIEKCEKPK